MKHEVKIGMTDYSVLVYIPDSASTDGSGKTGLAAANLTVSYTRVETDNDVVVTDATASLNDLANLTAAHADWGLKEVSNTLAPGLYRLDIADAVFASGAWSAVVYVMVTTSAAAASPMEFVMVPDAPITGVNVSLWNNLTTVALPLTPTTAGRTLDVSAGGEAGLDWANIGSPTTAQNLSATNIDVDQVVASVSGAVGSVTGAVGSVSAGGITSGSFAAGAIDATAIAANAIGASELAADAVAEIADAVWDEDATGHQTGGTFGQAIGDPGADTTTIYQSVVTDAAGTNVAADIIAIKAETAAIVDDTGTSGVVLANDAITAAKIAANAIGSSEIADGAITSAKFAAGAITATVIATDAIDADALADGAITAATFAAGAIDATAIAANAIGASELAADAVAEIADAVWEEAIADHSGTVGSTAEALNAAGSAGDPWTTALPGAYGAGSAGNIVGNQIPAIKTKTDSLTFTVAGQVDANIESVNGTTVNGSGTAGDPWGP